MVVVTIPPNNPLPAKIGSALSCTNRPSQPEDLGDSGISHTVVRVATRGAHDDVAAAQKVGQMAAHPTLRSADQVD